MGKILIIEDEESVNRGISFYLEKSGHLVSSCSTICEAKRLTRTFKPELVICDINLPDGSGLEYIKWIREENKVYIICLTALDQELNQVMGYEAGADDYVTKPFSLSILLLKVDVFFKRNTKEIDQSIVISENICVNHNEMRLKIKDQEVSLTKNEWKMLKFFLLHPKQILSKQQILNHVFDIEGEYIDENTLAVNIRRLREKIEENPAHPEYIKNIRGLGYVWDHDVN